MFLAILRIQNLLPKKVIVRRNVHFDSISVFFASKKNRLPPPCVSNRLTRLATGVKLERRLFARNLKGKKSSKLTFQAIKRARAKESKKRSCDKKSQIEVWYSPSF